MVTADGYRRLPDEEVGAIVETVIAARMDHPAARRPAGMTTSPSTPTTEERTS